MKGVIFLIIPLIIIAAIIGASIFLGGRFGFNNLVWFVLSFVLLLFGGMVPGVGKILRIVGVVILVYAVLTSGYFNINLPFGK